MISTLVGSTANDSVGYGGVAALTNGNYVVSSSYWNGAMGAASEIELARSTDEEKQSQLTRLRDVQARNGDRAPRWLGKLKQAVIENRNVFEVLVDAVRHCSLGQIAGALYEVGGQYRRRM